MPSEGHTPAECLDFDLAVMTWWDQFQAMANEPGQVRNLPPPRKDHHWGRKYTDAEIIRRLEGTSTQVLDPAIAGVSADDLMGLMDGWDA